MPWRMVGWQPVCCRTSRSPDACAAEHSGRRWTLAGPWRWMGAVSEGSGKTCEAAMVGIVAGAMSLLIGFGCWTSAASAHAARTGWQYPVECCGGHDCYEIEPSELE